MADARTLARSSPAGLAWYASNGQWIPAKHLILLSKRLIDVATGRTPRLIVTMPPRHGKSELISKYTPAWFLGTFPDRKVMLASYSDTFAAQWGRRSREVLEEFGPRLFGVRVSQDAKGGGSWELDRRSPALAGGGLGDIGIMTTAGVGGGLTGKGAHLMVIDDPVKNAEEAHSERTRAAHDDWWRSTARTRLQPGAGVVLVMTRWHEDDLAGRLLANQLEGGDEWEVLNLPAIAEPQLTDDEATVDLIGRQAGDVLWPEMFDRDFMDQTRRAMGEYWFSAMYQQRPAPAEGLLFKRENFRYYRKTQALNDNGDPLVEIIRDNGVELFDPGYGRKFQTCDVAASEDQQSDYTVISTWLVTPTADLLLWDRDRVQFDAADLKPVFKRAFYRHRPSLMKIERLGAGLQIIQELVREGLPIMRLEPDKDKLTRALPAVARYEEHRVFHPLNEAWVTEEWEPELLSFPNAKHDDQVDTVAYAALDLPSQRPAERVNSHRQKSKGETFTGGFMTAKF